MKITRMIKVTGIQENLDGDKNTIELTTEGSFYDKNGNYYIVYDESEISGMEGATTRLKIEDNKKVSMKRFGTSAADLKFEEGIKHETNYMTMYGNFTIQITTNDLNIQIDRDTGKGSIGIDYDLKISGGIETSNKLKVELM